MRVVMGKKAKQKIKTGVRGGYQPPGGGKKPKPPSTGSGVAVPKPFLPPQPQTLLGVIAAAARDPAVDTGKMKALLDMKYEEERRESENAYIVAMEAAQTSMPLVLRDTENPQTRSLYAKLETLSKVVDPVIHQNGFTLSFGMADSTLANHYRITCEVSHKAGHTRKYFYDLPTDDVGLKGNQNKTPLHAVASTTTYARRYLKTLIFDIRIAGLDDDGNRAASLPIDEKQLQKLKAKMAEVGADEAEFCAWLKVASLTELPSALLGKAFIGLEDKARMKKKAEAAA
jgi:hypothetical protein